VEAAVARNAELLERIATGRLDLALIWEDAGAGGYRLHSAGGAERIDEAQMCWIGASMPAWQPAAGEPLPLLAFDRPCQFHAAATAALDRAGMPWRVVFTSPSLAGLWAAAAAGLGLTVRTRYGLPGSVSALDAVALGLPALPALPLALVRAGNSLPPAAERLAAIVLDALHAQRALQQRQPSINI